MSWFESRRQVGQSLAARQGLRLSRIKRHTVFREMVKGELRVGTPSRRRYRQLIKYAARMGIEAAEAAELIDEARRALGLPPAPRDWASVSHRLHAGARFAPSWFALLLVVMAIAVIILLLGRVP